MGLPVLPHLIRPQDLIGALLFLGSFLTLGWLIAMVRRVRRRAPVLGRGSGCAQENPAGAPVCSQSEGHHRVHHDRRTGEHFPQALTGAVGGATFYRDPNGR
ncbi:hypothetical protein [Kocuria rosea]|uniref:hypothetical protein n=1 Tax=Kocuria rosea TaxID=1275 RepID=UPI000E068C7A|nr:hypothetical protein [Kocuria rosea]STX33408.1 Uncharacterised protein [Kocuria rosea]